ncbi:glycerol kinase GlpK [Eubacterium limosum]|uniref:ATP:glycerol 3-phosphotransferase n=1 Tax=Eubacterium limosum TaxID=1736 RepID=A0ABT5UJ67_EUBLI|nr:glycerol kinase [Eubacterium limosum]MCB6568607.1 glycerol kinase GlpK [Eubacterium limosum]MDE1468948.1 glycerol kinase GlpK [Eubacterium limosum]
MKNYVLVIDEGTTGTRALIFDKEFNIVSQCYEEFTQYTPSEDKVEHDAMEIYAKSVGVCREAIEKAKIASSDIAAIGITNQRATCLVWDKNTGVPLYNAIVWQDNRTAALCQEINDSEWGEKARKATGWTVAPVYSSLMLHWYLENVPEIKEKIESGEALFGTIDTWLIWKLTGGKSHVVSYSNASVMGSLDLSTGEWYTEFLDYLGISTDIYPEIVNDSGNYGTTEPDIFGAEIPICGAIADQHAALYAQGCRSKGTCKITNGTGSFLDINIGDECVVSDQGLNTVIAWKIGDEINYALEGFEAVTGSAVQWLRDGLQVIGKSSESEPLARSVEDSNGVYFVPALAGLSAPYHDPYARGTIFGISRGTTKAHIVRATLEGVAYRLKDILDVVEKESGVKMTDIRIDGGASMNDLLAQLMADMLDARVDRPLSVEATSLGAAEMAGLAAGLWTEADFDKSLEIDKSFEPAITPEKREELYAGWREAIERSVGWRKQA